MPRYVSVKLTSTVKERLEKYARNRGLTLSAAVSQLLETKAVIEELSELRRLLEIQNQLLNEQNQLLKKMLNEGSVKKIEEHRESEKQHEEEGLPSFAAGNPWIGVLSQRRHS